jgi:hypothetical protein
MTISCDKLLFSKIAFSRVKIRIDGLDESMSYGPKTTCYIRTHKIHHMVRGKTKKKKKKNRQQHRLLLLASLQL